MKNKYSDKLIQLIVQQKMLFIIGAIIFVMLVSVVSMSFISSNTKYKAVNDKTQSQLNTQDYQQASQLPANAPTPTDPPLMTKFFYFIGGFFSPGRNTIQTQNQYSNSGGQYSQSGSQTSTQNVSTQQNANAGSSNQSANSGGSGGGSGSSSTDNQQGSELNNPANSVTPTPVTDVQIIFKNEEGDYFTYIPPAIPPVDVIWMRYINHQDHYAIDYPSDWQMVKSNFNGHEGITLYMPGDAGNIDKPSIAFVGWKADYLSSSASYTGPIIVSGTPGTIYTNGPLGLSSISAVFQYANGYFALGSSASNPVFVYVFDHMLRSLDFNVQ